MSKLLTAFVALLTVIVASSSAQTPRYAFKPGDWYVYEVRTEQHKLGSDAPQRRFIEQVQIWCLDERPGEWQLLIDRIHVEKGEVSPSEALILWIDALGHRQVLPECDHRLPDFDSTLNLLPLLPPVLSSPDHWRSDPDHFQRICTGSTSTAEDGQLLLKMTRIEPDAIRAVSAAEARGLVQFDTNLNVVSQLNWTRKDPTLGVEQAVRARLVKRARRDAAWLRARQGETERYLQILRSDNAMRVIATQPFSVAQAQVRIPRLWEEFARSIRSATDSPFGRFCRAEQIRLAESSTQLRFQSLPLATWLGAKARSWTLSRPDGSEIRSEDARPGVTLEWYYSGSEPLSLYAAPLVQQLAASLPPEVTVIAYNVDQDPVRAAATAERLPGPWTHVMASPLLELEALNVLPAFRMIDADGVVRAAAIGWQSDLARLPAVVLPNWKGAQ